MRKVFVSYSRQSEPAARRLVDHLETLGHAVWFDDELSGGQTWWDQILANIRDSDVVALVLDPHSLASSACQREWTYAAAVGRPILPVLAAEGVSVNLLPPLLSKTQAVDYRDPSRAESALRLARALSSLPPATPLPDPLPAPPEVPMSYLGRVAERVDSTGALSLEDQSVLLVELRRGLRDPALAQDSRALLKRLRSRHDLLQAIAEDLDELLAGAPAAAAPPAPAPSPAAAPVVAPAAVVAAPRIAPLAAPLIEPDAAPPMPSSLAPPTPSTSPAAPAVPPSRKSALLLWGVGGAVFGGMGAMSIPGPFDADQLAWIAAPTAAAVLGRGFARSTRRGTVSLVAGAAIGFVAAAVMGGQREWFAVGTLIGAPIGALLLPLLERLLPAAGRDARPA